MKETELKLSNDLATDINKNEVLNQELEENITKYKKQENVINLNKDKKKEIEINLFHTIREKDNNNLKIENLKQMIESNNNLPSNTLVL